MTITRCKQHFIDWSAVGGKEKFFEDYANATDEYAEVNGVSEIVMTQMQKRRILINSVPLQTNPKWLAARRGNITCSTMKGFLGVGRDKVSPGEAYKKVVKRLVAETVLGFEDPEATWSEKDSIKRGLIFEARAIELFEQATGIKLKTDIGFISKEIDGLPFGASPDAYEGDIETEMFKTGGEIKSYESIRMLDEIEDLHSPDTMEQMQGQMQLFDCPRWYKILYCAEMDKIFYLKYTRGMDFERRLKARIPVALEYKATIEKNLEYSDLSEKIMES